MYYNIYNIIYLKYNEVIRNKSHLLRWAVFDDWALVNKNKQEVVNKPL